MASIEALVFALKQFEGTLIFISHDVYFIRRWPIRSFTWRTVVFANLPAITIAIKPNNRAGPKSE